MAFEIPGFKPAGFVAASDLRTKQFYCLKHTTTNNTVDLCSVAGEMVFGILQNTPNTNEAAEIMLMGISKVIASETLTANDWWGTASTGKAQKIDITKTGADVNNWAMGKVVVGAAANAYASVTINLIGHLVLNA